MIMRKREEAKKTNSQKGISCHAFGCKQPKFTKIRVNIKEFIGRNMASQGNPK